MSCVAWQQRQNKRTYKTALTNADILGFLHIGCETGERGHTVCLTGVEVRYCSLTGVEGRYCSQTGVEGRYCSYTGVEGRYCSHTGVEGRYLGQVFKAAAHQGMGAAVGGHLHGVLNQPQQFDRQLVDVQDVTEEHLHILG